LFDPKRYPWFADEFIHPRELAGSRSIAAGELPPIPKRARVARAS
jgi:hypothetical protein